MLLASCASRTTIELANESKSAIRKIHVSGSGFESSIASLAPGESVKLQPQIKGESGLAISFDAGTRHVDLPEDGYFEARQYAVRATIQEDLTLRIDSKITR